MDHNAWDFPDVVLVTGASGAVGLKLCEALVTHGISVVATDQSESPRSVMVATNGMTWVNANLEKPEDRQQLVEQVRLASIGSLGIVHNASFVAESHKEGWVGPLEDQSTVLWNRALEVGLTAPFAITRDLLAELKAFPNSSVVHVSSIYSSLGPDWHLYESTAMGNPVAYGVAKAGLEQMTRWMAATLAPEVRVNAVAPGGLLRNQPAEFIKRYEGKVPLGRMGSEKEVADLILFLLSSRASYITGQTIVVDGGYSII